MVLGSDGFAGSRCRQGKQFGGLSAERVAFGLDLALGKLFFGELQRVDGRK